ncbi:MAG: hypothetical protein EOM34_06145 [Clostridia bacterium]|nr:hypothetical protein [Lachnospiraceae bacterium]NCC00244.1 hypothetical protein [Clostridia bacterium]NCD02268.1 hypothetical protein [Clostridia bacterium]
MYKKTLTKPRKWDEESLALATKEELAADLLLRKTMLQFRETPKGPWGRYLLKREIHQLDMVRKELKQRQEWTVEEWE